MGASIERAVMTVLFASALATTAQAQDTNDEAECKPACRLGFECAKGQCVAEQCKPACRTGFVCIEGECKSPCNPPCGANERCTERAECVRLASRRADDDVADDAPTKHENKTIEKPATKYEPSVVRLYVGPMMFSASLGGSPLFTDPGGTVAADFHLDDTRTFFIGVRFGAWGDSTGVAYVFDLDVGLRPRLWAGTDAAVSLTVGGGLGGVYIAAGPSSSGGGFHMPLRVGPCFDFGAFTFEVVGGPALYAGRSAFGAFEGILEIGARF